MTIHPIPNGFNSARGARSSADMQLHPNVQEAFWGYELRMNERQMTMSTVVRVAAGVVATVTAGAAVGIWMVPAQNASGEGFLSTVLATVLLIVTAGVCANSARRGTDVRVQVDCRNGELREVVDNGFGGVETVARYGFDAIRDIRIRNSHSDPSFGQLVVEIERHGEVPIADGAISALRGLRDRVTSDCGGGRGTSTPAQWGGPLRA